MKILTKPLEDALNQLDRNIALAGSDFGATQNDLRVAVRTASIKSFEYSYELSITLIKRVLENYPGSNRIDELSFRGLIRKAAEHGLVQPSQNWESYREKRNKTSHTYNQALAIAVFEELPEFARSARALLDRVRAIHAAS